MSQLLLSKATSSMFNRVTTTTTTSLINATQITKSSILPNPAFPIKLYHPIQSQARSYMHMHKHTHNNTLQNKERILDNISKIYARRVLAMASLSAATMTNKTKMEQEFIPKPSNWGVVDLVQQRKEFGENISSLGSTKISRVWAAGSRIFNLALLAAPFSILVPISYLTGSESKTTNFTWNYALWSVEQAGPTLIKLMQWATTRHDLFPPEFITRFSALQDNTRGHKWHDTEKLLIDEIGERYFDLLDFDMNDNDSTSSKHGDIIDNDNKSKGKKSYRKNDKYSPIGSGCVAQVYKAKLKQDMKLVPAGTEVAIKVAHPNILHKVCVDFYILNFLTSCLEMIPAINLDYLSMKDSVEQFRDIMLPQLDLRIEANNLKRFRKDFENDEHVSFPMPIDDLTSANVLVESFIHGETILDFCEQGRRTNSERELLAKIGLETVMKMIFMYDFVHGDLHPGNILVNRNMDVKGHPWRLNMIDCGLVVEMGEQDHVNLVKVLGAFIKKDGRKAGELMIDTAKKCQASPMDMELFCRGIQRICEDDDENNFLESVGDYLADICYLACKHKVKLEASFMNAALACEIMEGIASKLYPTMQVQHIALPLVFKAEAMHRLNETFSFLK